MLILGHTFQHGKRRKALQNCRCHLTNLSAALLFVSHMESCARGICADLQAPLADAAVAFKPHPRRSHGPFTASLANPLHLWHLALVWASAHSVIPRHAPSVMMQSPNSTCPPHASLPFIPGAALSSTVEEGTDPTLDAAEAVDKLERHVLALVDKECATADVGLHDTQSQQVAHVLLTDSSAPRQFVRPQVLPQSSAAMSSCMMCSCFCGFFGCFCWFSVDVPDAGLWQSCDRDCKLFMLHRSHPCIW